MTTLRIASLGLALTLLQACAAQPVVNDQTTLQRIAANSQVNIGYRTTQPPMAFLDENGTPVGYSIDLCGKVVGEIGATLGVSDLSVNFVPVTAENRFTTLESGQIDILCGATTKTLTRQEKIAFTQLTFVTGGSLLTLEKNGVKGLAGMKGRRIAVSSNTTTIASLRSALSKANINAEVVPVASAEEGMTLLDSGDVHALAADQVVLIGLVLARPSSQKYALAEELFSYEPFALAIRRGDPDMRLAADRALSRLSRTGEIGAIYTKWFRRFAETPPPAMKALFALMATPE